MSASGPEPNGPNEQAPLEELFGSVFGLAGEIASRISPDEIEVKLRRTLLEAGHHPEGTPSGKSARRSREGEMLHEDPASTLASRTRFRTWPAGHTERPAASTWDRRHTKAPAIPAAGTMDTAGRRFSAGARIAGYRLEERIGRGGMAEVFSARDERHGRQVALKILSPELSEDPVFRNRFIRESRAAAAVQDPHIIPVFEAGEANGALFIAMPLIDGGDAGSFARRNGPLPPAQVAEIASQAASALDAAHARGLVHRDVKPANMLLDVRPGLPDHVYLSDFGLTEALLDSGSLTAAGQFLGTVDYAAPEQINGHPVDGRTDQYALGCSAFELLCGEPPFRRGQVAATVYAHLAGPPPLATSQLPGLPSEVDRVFARVLAKSPAERYGTCQEFAEALRRALGLRPYVADAGDTPQERPLRLVYPERGAPPHEPAAGLRLARRRHRGAEVPPARKLSYPAASAATKVTAPAGTTKQKLRKRTRLSQPLAVVIAAVIAAVIGLAGAVINILGPLGPATTGPTQTPTSAPANSAVATAGPPSASVVTVLMAEEAAAAVAHRPADAIRLYVSTGFVRDDACGKPSQSHTWSGRDQILQWYQQLGRFSWLTHLSPEVSFTPDNAQATSATATAQTAGFTEPSATSPAGQEIHGNERWTFIRMNGKWLISSYTYNICLTGPEILKLRRAAK